MKSAVPFWGVTYIVRGESRPLADVEFSFCYIAVLIEMDPA